MVQLVLKFQGYKNMVSVASVHEASQRLVRAIRNHGISSEDVLPECGNVLQDGQVVAKIESNGNIVQLLDC
jgi:hypothetical protein